MAKDFEGEPDLHVERVYQLLEEIQLSQPADADTVRAQRGMRVTGAVRITAGNVCDRGAVLAEGVVRELHRTAASCSCPLPVMVGSIFHLQFDRSLDLPPLLAMCERCAMLEEESFEVRFRFLQEVDLPRKPGDER